MMTDKTESAIKRGSQEIVLVRSGKRRNAKMNAPLGGFAQFKKARVILSESEGSPKLRWT